MFTYEVISEIAKWIDECVGDDPDAVRLIVRDGSVMETDGVDTWELSSSVVDGVTYYATDGWVWDADGDSIADDVDTCPVCNEPDYKWSAEGCSCWLCNVCMTTNPKGDNACRSCRTCQPA